MGRFDTGLVDIHNGFSIEAGVNLIDEQEDVDPLALVGMDILKGRARSSPRPMTKTALSRRRLEEKLEEMELRREIGDYSPGLH